MSPSEPLLTVVIPTFNRSSVLTRCLEALASQTVPREAFEVIVADDGSTDGTEAEVTRLIPVLPAAIRYIRQPNTGANAARNNAIRNARGSLLLFINDDTIATPEMLARHLETHRAFPEEGAAVLGKVTISLDLEDTVFARLHLDATYRQWEGQTRLDWRAFYTCNVSMKRAFLLKYGLFEESIRWHEDVELSARLARHGLTVIYNPAALGYHYHRLDEKGLFRIAEMEGRSFAAWYRKAPFLAGELALLGFYPTMGRRAQVKYLVADACINRLTSPFLLMTARCFSRLYAPAALFLYRKLFQAVKRRTIRTALREKSHASPRAPSPQGRKEHLQPSEALIETK